MAFVGFNAQPDAPMVLLPNALDTICAQLTQLSQGQRVPIITVGQLRADQVDLLNKLRSSLNLEPVNGELVFLGRHIYQRRIVDDGYSIPEVRLMLEMALHPHSVVHITSRSSTIIQSATFRDDAYGNRVRDEVVFELSNRTPRVEILSVIPRGDKNKPKNKKPLDGGA